MSGSAQLQFYLARVHQARAEAAAATLGHVRERCLRSESAWQALASRAERTEAMREKLLLAKSSGQLA
jgi:hypothetical protein